MRIIDDAIEMTRKEYSRISPHTKRCTPTHRFTWVRDTTVGQTFVEGVLMVPGKEYQVVLTDKPTRIPTNEVLAIMIRRALDKATREQLEKALQILTGGHT